MTFHLLDTRTHAVVCVFQARSFDDAFYTALQLDPACVFIMYGVPAR